MSVTLLRVTQLVMVSLQITKNVIIKHMSAVRNLECQQKQNTKQNKRFGGMDKEKKKPSLGKSGNTQ